MKKHQFLTAAIALLLTTTATQAQFIASMVPELSAGTTTTPTKIAADAKYFRTTLGGPIQLLNVLAWDGTASGSTMGPAVQWSIQGGTSGSFQLPAGATIPEVVLTSDINNMNTYLVYAYLLNGNFYCVTRPWNGTAFGTLTTANWADVAGPYTPSISLDATGNGDVVLALGRSDGSIQVRTGTNASMPSIPASTGLLAAGTGHQADVCINSTGSTSTNVRVSYTNQFNTSVSVVSAPFSTLVFGTPTVIAVPGGFTTYVRPHIASPRANASSCPAADVYSVIYDEITTSTYNIHLYSVDNAGTTNVILSNASTGFPPYAFTMPKNPVVAYNESYSFQLTSCTGTLVALWTGNPSSGHSVVGEKVRSNGIVWGPARYYDIPNPTRLNCDYAAVSSKYAGDEILAAFYDGPTSTIKYKDIGWGLSTMRTAQNNSISATAAEKNIAVYPNPAADHLYIDCSGFAPDAAIGVQVTDMTGRVNYTIQTTPSTLQSQANDWFSQLAPGIYHLQCSDAAGYNQSLKIVKQ